MVATDLGHGNFDDERATYPLNLTAFPRVMTRNSRKPSASIART